MSILCIINFIHEVIAIGTFFELSILYLYECRNYLFLRNTRYNIENDDVSILFIIPRKRSVANRNSLAKQNVRDCESPII